MFQVSKHSLPPPCKKIINDNPRKNTFASFLDFVHRQQNYICSHWIFTALPENTGWISGDCFIVKGKWNRKGWKEGRKKWKEEKRGGEKTPFKINSWLWPSFKQCKPPPRLSIACIYYRLSVSSHELRHTMHSVQVSGATLWLRDN